MAKTIPLKCQKCAMLDAAQAQALHGSGDGCWNPKVCYSRRSYARHRDRKNQQRNRSRQESVLKTLEVEIPEFAYLYYAVLVVYRAAGGDTPVHAVSAQVWQGQQQIAVPSAHAKRARRTDSLCRHGSESSPSLCSQTACVVR